MMGVYNTRNMYSEPSSGIKLTAYSCICWLFHSIYYDAWNHKHKILYCIVWKPITQTREIYLHINNTQDSLHLCNTGQTSEWQKLPNYSVILLFLGLTVLNCIKIYYRVNHKSLRDFQTRMRNNQDRHGRKEHINRYRISPSFFCTRGLGVLPGSTARGQS